MSMTAAAPATSAPRAKPGRGQPGKFSLDLAGYRTSVSLEPDLVPHLHRMAAERGMPVIALVRTIAAERGRAPNLTRAVRLAIFADLQSTVTQQAAWLRALMAEANAAAAAARPS